MQNSSETFTCIAVDMGASSIRVMLGTLGKDGLVQREVRRMPNGTVFSEGHERWDINTIFHEITEGINEAWELSGGSAESVGIDSWGVDFVLLDEGGSLMELPVSYRDGRTEGMQEIWEAEMSAFETFRRTGINFYQFNTLYQLLSIRDEKLLLEASTLLFLPSYIGFLLTGKAYNELTIASTSQLLGVKGDLWDPEIIGKLRLNDRVLAPVIHPGSLLGRVFPEVAGGTTLEAVAVCGHDTASVVSAIPAEDGGYVYISAGTWCIVGIESTVPLLGEAVFQSGFTNERGYGNSYRILKNIVGLWLLQGLRKKMEGGISFEEMEQMAMKESENMLLIDPGDPLFYNPEDMKSAFDLFFMRTGQEIPKDPGGYIRCAYLSLCFSFRTHIEMLERFSGRVFSRIHLVGGGSQSEFLNQQIANICNRTVISGPVEAASLGNILVQSVGMGKVADLTEGRSLIRESCQLKHYIPGPETDDDRKLFQKYVSIKR
jgi:rhamnulokinase